MKKLIAAGLIPLLIFVGCSSQATDSVTSTVTAQVTMAVTTTVTEVSTSMETRTVTTGPNASIKTCKEFRNSINAAGLIDVLDSAIVEGHILPMALSGPLAEYHPAAGGAADSSIADPVGSFNNTANTLRGEAFTLYSRDDVRKLIVSYREIKTACTGIDAWS